MASSWRVRFSFTVLKTFGSEMPFVLNSYSGMEAACNIMGDNFLHNCGEKFQR